MAAYRRVYDSRHPQADYQEPGSAPETTLGNRVCATFLARNRQFDGRNVVSAYSPILAAKGLCPLGWANVIETRCTPVTGIGITFSFAFRQTAFACVISRPVFAVCFVPVPSAGRWLRNNLHDLGDRASVICAVFPASCFSNQTTNVIPRNRSAA